jgi:hypothetical protein
MGGAGFDHSEKLAVTLTTAAVPDTMLLLSMDPRTSLFVGTVGSVVFKLVLATAASVLLQLVADDATGSTVFIL